MRFVDNGPDVPAELIAAQESGEVVFLCGAGVSMTVGLPSFRELVEATYDKLDETWVGHPAEVCVMETDGTHAGQYDRAVRALERRITLDGGSASERQRLRLRTCVSEQLKAPLRAKLDNHAALLALSRDALGRTRIVTTNFDTLFERAWLKQLRARPPSHSGPAMPQPGSPLFEGVFHLHGRIGDPHAKLRLAETDVVLTSSEFGEAYLRSGWAARYVYDLARTNIVVIVGYQAEDPPMRYLLEVLDADRSRFPDLRAIYALAPFNDKDPQGEIWKAKGIQPIVYGQAGSIDHSACYATLQEWTLYSDDPSRWRTERLREVAMRDPSATEEGSVAQAVSLLSHGDAAKILAEANPGPNWIAPLYSANLLRPDRARPGPWLEQRLCDPMFITESAGRIWFDDGTVWLLDRALARDDAQIAPLLRKAWRALLYHQADAPDRGRWDHTWFGVQNRIRRGEIDHEIVTVVVDEVRPRPRFMKPFRLREEDCSGQEPARLSSLMWVDYREPKNTWPSDILAAWPQETEAEVTLLRALTRALADALTEARDLDFIEGFDRASSDVPSVSSHSQNNHRSGFMPIVRLMADLWDRLATRSPEDARRIVARWRDEGFLLFQRLALHALCQPDCFHVSEVTESILALDDRTFWFSDAQREITRLITERSSDFDGDAWQDVEARLSVGPSRSLFPDNAFDDDSEWQSLLDHSRYRRLKRVEASGIALGQEVQQLLTEIEGRHPKWRPGSGDRDDFNSWSEMRHGPQGDPKHFVDIPVGQLVDEGIRLNRDHNLESGQAWELYCKADSRRALAGLRAKAQKGQWEPWAWRAWFWAGPPSDPADQVLSAVNLIDRMPDDCIGKLTHAIAGWLRSVNDKKHFDASDEARAAFFTIWDRLADICFASGVEGEPVGVSDAVTHAINEDGGVLAEILIERMWAQQPPASEGFPDSYEPRFDLLLDSSGRPGILARVRLAWDTRLLYQVAPGWTASRLLPLLNWSSPEAALLWQARSRDRYFVGPPALFNELKVPFLQAFERPDTESETLRGLIQQLLFVALWQRRPKDAAYGLTSAEVKRALSVVSPEIRHSAAWQFFDWMKADGDVEISSAERWRTEVGPLFSEVWPRDSNARDEQTTKYLTWMAIEADEAFPEVVDTILEYLVPGDLRIIRIELRQEKTDRDLASEFPAAYVKLLGALIDVRRRPIPDDLGTTLETCEKSDPSVRSMPEFRRLKAAWKKRAS